MKTTKHTQLFIYQSKARNDDSECSKCKRKYYLTVDHIIPIQILLSLNLKDEVYEWEDNYQIICGACNKLKASNLDISNPKTYILLEEAIKRSKEQLK